MRPEDWLNRCHFGDVRDVLARMVADGVKVQTIVTSPPYWGLRDYGRPGQLGLEATPDEYVAAMVGVFTLCHQVLADDGTLWLNLGDSYATSAGATDDRRGRSGNLTNGGVNGAAVPTRRARPVGDLKPKDLVGIPWMTAFALRAEGWYLRQGIIWSKPNPMPESVRDRCTKSHEDIFLMSKSSSYYCDMGAIKEPVAPASVQRLAQDVDRQQGSLRVPGKTNGAMKAVGGSRSKRDSFKRSDSKRGDPIPGQGLGTHRENREESEWPIDERNKRSVWTVSTKPYKGAHFATFPADLIEPCILAGAPAGGIVLDPFFGSGTTGQVAQALGRRFIGIELNTDYKALQDQRLQQPSLEFSA